MEQAKPNAGLHKLIILGAIVVIIVIITFIFSDMFADARTTIALMLMTAAVMFIWNRRKSRTVLSANEIAVYIANTMVRDGYTLRLNPSPNNIIVEESGIDRVMVGFVDKKYVFTYSRKQHKILESWRGHPMERIQERRHDSLLISKIDDMAIRVEEKKMEYENEGM